MKRVCFLVLSLVISVFSLWGGKIVICLDGWGNYDPEAFELMEKVLKDRIPGAQCFQIKMGDGSWKEKVFGGSLENQVELFNKTFVELDEKILRGKKFDLVCSSQGGLIGWMWALKYNKDSRVENLFIMSSMLGGYFGVPDVVKGWLKGICGCCGSCVEGLVDYFWAKKIVTSVFSALLAQSCLVPAGYWRNPRYDGREKGRENFFQRTALYQYLEGMSEERKNNLYSIKKIVTFTDPDPSREKYIRPPLSGIFYPPGINNEDEFKKTSVYKILKPLVDQGRLIRYATNTGHECHKNVANITKIIDVMQNGLLEEKKVVRGDGIQVEEIQPLLSRRKLKLGERREGVFAWIANLFCEGGEQMQQRKCEYYEV
ncbi:MAG: hypothetical protein JW725_03850 [Candidatus Babeliaceae bacterium]|nr:hypothetical protein [Candidatus Babeliaceae bacterium]